MSLWLCWDGVGVVLVVWFGEGVEVCVVCACLYMYVYVRCGTVAAIKRQVPVMFLIVVVSGVTNRTKVKES